MRKNKKIILIVLISILVIVGAIFTIDHYRINKNLLALFSTWGNKYATPIKK